MSFSEFTQKDYDLINKAYAGLSEVACKRCANKDEMSIVKKAFDFANEAHKNVRRRSGEPYMLHPIAVARIVVESVGLGYKSIVAALLHDVVEDTDYTIEDIRNLFGDKIASLVDGLTKIKTVLDNEEKNKAHSIYSQSVQAENFKRILLTLNDDVRVALIKLADRLHNCRTIEFMPEHKRDKILSETMFIFVPLAHRLGLYEVKSEMENIWLKYKEPEAYKEITAKIDKNVNERDEQIDSFIEPISEALKAAGFDFEIKKRVKTPYSIWHKMQTKNVAFDEIYDLYAVRIIFNSDLHSSESERDKCYHIFSIITGIYKYKASRMRDWVKHPKSNGYEALHCTLMSNFGSWIEVQIRSRRMDDIAEKGIAAHWAYKKEGFVGENDSEMDKWLVKIKEILVSDDISALELLDIIHNDLTSTDITVFTPKGDQKTIQKGATALDFAYLINANIGNKAIAAKINMRLMPLSAVLHSGDQVEIITAKSGEPKVEWLQFLQTRHAKILLIDRFRYRQVSYARDGRKMLEDYLKISGHHNNEMNIRQILDMAQLKDRQEMYFRIGIGLITMNEIANALNKSNWTPKEIKEGEYIIDKTSVGRQYVIADCCKPIPGDPVVGFVTPEGKVEVHKKSCPVAEVLASKHGNWMITPQWGAKTEEDFLVKVTLKGLDRVGLLTEISNYLSKSMGVNMKKIHLSTEDGIFDGYIELFVKDKSTLDEIINNLSSIESIQSITRSDI